MTNSTYECKLLRVCFIRVERNRLKRKPRFVNYLQRWLPSRPLSLNPGWRGRFKNRKPRGKMGKRRFYRVAKPTLAVPICHPTASELAQGFAPDIGFHFSLAGGAELVRSASEGGVGGPGPVCAGIGVIREGERGEGNVNLGDSGGGNGGRGKVWSFWRGKTRREGGNHVLRIFVDIHKDIIPPHHVFLCPYHTTTPCICPAAIRKAQKCCVHMVNCLSPFQRLLLVNYRAIDISP